MILEQTIDLAGKVRILWQQPSGKVYFFKFDSEPTLEHIQSLANNRDSIEEYDNEQSLEISSFSKENVMFLVEIFKTRPNIGLTQFNNVVNNLNWYQIAQIKAIIYEIGTKLAERKDISLDNLTELQVFQRVRDFIANTPIKKLKKIFNGFTK